MKILVASDHAGYELKLKVVEHLKERGIEVEDLGCYSEDPVDYPVYGKKCGEALMAGKGDLGMVFCGTGIGISMAANKVRGVRCANVTSVDMAVKAKQHNNANILAMGGRITDPDTAIRMTDAWLDEKFLGGHHQPRVDMLNEM
ncbi:MAG: ribose 5-phosphate isomerase B [Anaerovoracaceae bacterium]|jgi:ribose 5-phosphate isomerase B